MSRGTIVLTQEEQRRLKVLTEVREGRLRANDAVRLLGLSVRHCRRMLARFRQQGAAALAHGNRGHPPHNRRPAAVRTRVIRLARTTYAGFNHQHLTEVLAEEHGLTLSYPTVHRWLLAAGLPSPHPRRPRRHRRRRERMPQAGLLVQLDASHHDWLEGRGPALVLHSAIDDATNRVPAALFRAQEDAAGYFWILRAMVRAQGRPVALYGDRHGIFHRDPRRPVTIHQQLHGLQHAPTQVERAVRELGVRWIPATSPQAKGRIERLWGTLQDRLVSELRRARARTLPEANVVLAQFLPRYNARFTHPPADPHSAYRPLPADVDLETICCFAYERTVANDNTVQLGEHLLQILPGPRRESYAKARVIVREHLDGALSVRYRGEALRVQPIQTPARRAPSPLRARDYQRLRERPPGQVVTASPPNSPRRRDSPRPAVPYRPGADHPWNRAARQGLQRKLLRRARVTFSLNT